MLAWASVIWPLFAGLNYCNVPPHLTSLHSCVIRHAQTQYGNAEESMGSGPEIAVDHESGAEPRLLGGGVRHRGQQHRERTGKYTLSSHNQSSGSAALISRSSLNQHRVKQGGGVSLTSPSMLQQRITELDQQREELKIEVSFLNENYDENIWLRWDTADIIKP